MARFRRGSAPSEPKPTPPQQEAAPEIQREIQSEPPKPEQPQEVHQPRPVEQPKKDKHEERLIAHSLVEGARRLALRLKQSGTGESKLKPAEAFVGELRKQQKIGGPPPVVPEPKAMRRGAQELIDAMKQSGAWPEVTIKKAEGLLDSLT